MHVRGYRRGHQGLQELVVKTYQPNNASNSITMGSEESKPQAAPAKGSPTKQQPGPIISAEDLAEYDGIPPVHPLIKRNPDQFPADIGIPSKNLPVAHKLIRDYFQQISFTINRNQENLTVTIKKQMEDYIALAGLLDRRRSELEGKLAQMLSLFRTLDTEVRATTEMLDKEVEKADKLAAQIDPNFAKFEDFKKQ